MYKLIGADGKEYGPATTADISDWIAKGRCDGGTLARLEGSSEWKPLGEFPEFSRTLGVPAGRSGDGLAVASLVCGVVGMVVCVTAPVGLVLGLAARKKSNHPGVAARKSSLATAGIVVSAVAMGISLLVAPILAGLLLPALAKAKQRAQTINCRANMEQLTTAVLAYATEHAGRLPPVTGWCDAISNRVASPRIFRCPTRPDDECSYAMNQRTQGGMVGKMNAKTVLLFESDAGWNGAGGEDKMVTRNHSISRVNRQGTVGQQAVYHVTFVDGTFASLPESGLVALRWDP